MEWISWATSRPCRAICHCRNQWLLRQNTGVDDRWLSSSGRRVHGGVATTPGPLLFLLLRIRQGLFFFFFIPSRLSRLGADQTLSTFLRSSNIPFQSDFFFPLSVERTRDVFPVPLFEVSHLCASPLEDSVSGGISAPSNIYDYFGRQLEGLHSACGAIWCHCFNVCCIVNQRSKGPVCTTLYRSLVFNKGWLKFCT